MIINWIRFWSIKMICPGEFPGGPLVKTWAFTAVDSGSTLVRELRSYKPCSAAKHTHTHTHTHTSGVSCCDSVMSNSLRHHELQHSRFSCLSLSLWVCSNSCPLSQWCHPTISSSATRFSSCPQSGGRDGMNWETGIDVDTLLILCIEY